MPIHRVARVLLQVTVASGVWAVSTATPARGQSTPSPLWRVDSIKSTVLGETRVVRISVPHDYEGSIRAGERFPVLLVMDMLADDLLTSTIANARVLAKLETPAIPPLIVVGIETERNRYRDMVPPVPAGADSSQAGGDAPRFARFLETELLPYLAARYRTLPFTIVAGHSLSGLFAAYVYGQSPGFVSAAIAISPSLIWNDGRGVDRVAEGVRARTARGRLFVAAGIPEVSLDSAALRLAASLRDHPGPSTTFEHRRLADDSHYTSLLQGMIDGLRFVFRPIQLASNGNLDMRERPWSAEQMLANYRVTRERYLSGARELGLPERLPHTFSGGLGLWLSASNRASAAREICQDVIGEYADVWVGYDCMGSALRALRDTTGAVSAYRRGIALAEPFGEARTIARMRRALDAILPKPPYE